MASNFYDKHLPDYGDLDNATQNHPGFTFGIRENDAGVGIYMGPVADDFDGNSYYRAFLNPEEAEELVAALQEAIRRARSQQRGPGHPRRVR